MDFKFITDNSTVRVRFHYEAQNAEGVWEHGGRALSNLTGKRIFTFCEVSVKPAGQEQFSGIAGDYVTLDPRDKFNKAAGRRLALARALHQVPNRELRSAVWNNYFDEHREGWTMAIASEEA